MIKNNPTEEHLLLSTKEMLVMDNKKQSMRKSFYTVFLFLGAAGLLLVPLNEAFGGPIYVTTGAAPFYIVDDFSSIQGDISGIYYTKGANIAEAFFGQDVIGGEGIPFVNERAIGTPTNPLELMVPSSQDGVSIGIGHVNDYCLLGMANGPIGEGVISIYFLENQFAIGLAILGGSGGAVTLDFFSRDGSLFDSVNINNISDAKIEYTFSSSISEFAGITISNTDHGGIGIDDLRLSSAQASVPEPSTILLLTAGITGIGLLRIKRKRLK